MKINFKSMCSFIKEHKYLIITTLSFIIYLTLYLIKIVNTKSNNESHNIIGKCFNYNSESFSNDRTQFLNMISLLKNDITILTTVSRDSFCYDIVLNTNNTYNFYVHDIFMFCFMCITTGINIIYYINNKSNNKLLQILPINDNKLSTETIIELQNLPNLSDLSSVDIENQ